MSQQVKRRRKNKPLVPRINWSNKIIKTDDSIDYRSHMIATIDDHSFRIESVIASNGRRKIIDETNIYKMFNDIAWDHVSLMRKSPACLLEEQMKEMFIEFVMSTP